MKIGIYDVDKIWCEQMRQIVENYAKQMTFDIEMCFFDRRNAITDYGIQYRFPDVFFVSLDQNEKESIEIAREVKEESQECQIVFCSNCFDYAMDVYAVDHTYFVVKEQFKTPVSANYANINSAYYNQSNVSNSLQNNFNVNSNVQPINMASNSYVSNQIQTNSSQAINQVNSNYNNLKNNINYQNSNINSNLMYTTNNSNVQNSSQRGIVNSSQILYNDSNKVG